MKDSRGVSLVELLLVMAAIGFLGLLIANVPSSISLISTAKHISLAREIASKQIETKRATLYINLINGEEQISDLDLGTLFEGNGQIITSDCENCDLEVKKVEVKVTWKESGKPQTVKLDTLISKGGLNQ